MLIQSYRGTLSRASLCPGCEATKMDDLYDDHLADLVVAQDPALDPTHQPATDSEWWSWVLDGGRD